MAMPPARVVFPFLRGTSIWSLRMIRTQPPSPSGSTQPKTGAMTYATSHGSGLNGCPAHWPCVWRRRLKAVRTLSTRSGSNRAPGTLRGSGVMIAGGQSGSGMPRDFRYQRTSGESRRSVLLERALTGTISLPRLQASFRGWREAVLNRPRPVLLQRALRYPDRRVAHHANLRLDQDALLLDDIHRSAIGRPQLTRHDEAAYLAGRQQLQSLELGHDLIPMRRSAGAQRGGLGRRESLERRRRDDRTSARVARPSISTWTAAAENLEGWGSRRPTQSR